MKTTMLADRSQCTGLIALGLLVLAAPLASAQTRDTSARPKTVTPVTNSAVVSVSVTSSNRLQTATRAKDASAGKTAAKPAVTVLYGDGNERRDPPYGRREGLIFFTLKF